MAAHDVTAARLGAGTESVPIVPSKPRGRRGSVVGLGGAMIWIVVSCGGGGEADRAAKSIVGWAGDGAAATGVTPLPSVQRGPLVLIDRAGWVQSSMRLGASALRRDDES